MRACHIAYTFYEEDNRVTRYAETLSAAGYDVDVIALRRPGQPTIGERSGVRVFRIQQRSVTERSSWTYLAKIALFLVRATALVTVRHLRRRYDIIHIHNVPDFLVFAALVPRAMRTPVILDIHDILPELYAGKFHVGTGSRIFRSLLLAERLSCRFATHVIVANDIWRAKLVGRAVPQTRCTTVLNYPDLRLFKPAASRPRRSDGTFIMLYPGSLNHHQGLHVAIEAFARVRDRMPGAEFHIYGEGPALDGLRELTVRRGLQDRVRFHEPVTLEAIAGVMSEADLGVEPKLAERFSGDAVSTKILEFMSCGVPVVASRTPAHAYYFSDAVLRFFPAGDHEALGEAMVESYEHRAERAGSVVRAREFAVSYGWQRRAGDYCALVDALARRLDRGASVSTRPAA